MNGQAFPWGPERIGDYSDAASSHNKSLSIHRWAKWIAGFSGEFARSAIRRHLPSVESRDTTLTVLDPFAGVGTTLIEASRLGLNTIGFEINPFAAMVCRVKMGAADVCPDELLEALRGYERFMESAGNGRVPINSPPVGFRSRIPFFSPAVERKVLFTLDYFDTLPPRVKQLFSVALASVMVEFSNYTYEPSLGTRPAAGKALVGDANVTGTVGDKVRDMAVDIAELLMETPNGISGPEWRIHECSFFDAESYVDPSSVDLVLTSPPYMNNYHYVRNSRPQMYWAGLVNSPAELKRLEFGNFGKFWQTVRADDPIPLKPDLSQLEREIDAIRGTNTERGVYGGNGWANYVTSYMNDLDRFCELLLYVLKPGGIAIVVVGNSIVQGREIKVEETLCDIANLRGLSAFDISRLRDRVGSSIVNSGPRLRNHNRPTLYDSAVAIRRPY